MARPKNEKIDSSRVKIALYSGDWEKLQRLFPSKGAGPAVRDIVRQFLRHVDSQVSDVGIDIAPATLEDILQ